jgi:acyl-[acyl carrier protein]--UDP-N-acetylglucosamine O-acyltransferase
VIHPTALTVGSPEHRDWKPGDDMWLPQIHKSARIEAYVTVDCGMAASTCIGARVWLMKKVHVGHDAYIGEDAEIAPLCSIGGHVEIGKRVRVGQGATFKPYVKVGDDARIGMGSVVICDVPAGETWAGNPARRIHPAPRQPLTHLELAGWRELQDAEDVSSAVWQDWWLASRV